MSIEKEKGQMPWSKSIVPTKRIFMRKIKALALTVQKLFARLKIEKCRSDARVKETG